MGASGPDPVDIHVGARLRLRRLQLGMNQKALAETINVTLQQVQKYELGANRLSASRLYRCARALSVPPSYFFEELVGGAADEAIDLQAASSPFMTAQTLELVTSLPAIKPKLRTAILQLTRGLAKAPRQSALRDCGASPGSGRSPASPGTRGRRSRISGTETG
jgi:transcriptional regulator with XRE-family HTH domain